jgi:16S rRNA (cytosine1402-N4)-methyltransferase
VAAQAFRHRPVLPAETMELLAPRPGETFLDGTVGGGGHARLILEATSPDGRLIGLDRDQAALRKTAQVLAPFGKRVILRHANFAAAAQVLQELGIDGLDGMLFDLGVSSHQLDETGRGFSFRGDAPLDMRMDPTTGPTAADIINSVDADELVRIFREYGEERYARRIAREIVRVRAEGAILTTRHLAELVRRSVPGGMAPARIHPATRVFQALRIEVNRELDYVRAGVSAAIDLLKPGGRLAVISFHSLEDRIVKRIFQEESRGCVCPPRLPTCICGHTPRVEMLVRKGVRATPEELAVNPRARSAILRAARRCA